jgi:L-asparaginase
MPARPVHVLAVGGTISMRGERARPALGADDLVQAVPQLASVEGLSASTIAELPGVQLGLDDALAICNRAVALARDGAGVVVTTGTDTLEELAVLCDLVYEGAEPVAFTGAARPASAAGADGPANLLDAVAFARSAETADLGVCVIFAGEIHSARAVRKSDSVGPTAFASPLTGPLGRIVEGRPWLAVRPPRTATLAVSELSGSVPIIPCGLGDDGTMLTLASEHGADGIVAVACGAGHAPPAYVERLARAAATVPVVVTCRPERSVMLRETYGFAGSEQDLRDARVIPAPLLSPPAARIKLLACLGAGLGEVELRAAFADDDA